MGKRRVSELVIAMAILFVPATPALAANPDMTAEFGQTCVASKSIKHLKAALTTRGWRLLPTLSQSHLEREIAAVAPVLEAQGLSSNYTVYRLDTVTQHLELAVSETIKPIKGAR